MEVVWELDWPGVILNYNYGPSWAIQGLIDSLKARPDMFTTLSVSVQLLPGYSPFQVGSLAVLLDLLPHLRTLQLWRASTPSMPTGTQFFSALPIEIDSLARLLGLPRPRPHFVEHPHRHFALRGTNRRARLLRPSQSHQGSPRRCLHRCQLRCWSTPPRRFTAPDPSFTTTLSLGPIQPSHPLPLIPNSVKFLTLDAITLPDDDEEDDTIASAFFTSLGELLRSHSALQTLHLRWDGSSENYSFFFQAGYVECIAEAEQQGDRASASFADDEDGDENEHD